MSTITDWEDQRAFLAILDGGSLSEAARRLGVAQPTVRARLSSLERALGTVLFTRSVKGLVPTDEARALVEAARAMARASEAFVRAASARPGDVAGTVRLSVSEFVGVEVLPRMLAPLRERHPDLVLEFALSNASANLLEQEVDVAVRMYPPRQEALIAKKVASLPLGLFGHVDYLARRGEPKTREDLASHDFIGPDRTLADLEIAAVVMPDVPLRRLVVRTDSHPAQFAALRAGLGLAFVLRAAGREEPKLRQLLPDLALPSLDVWIVTHENLRELPRVRAVFDHLTQAFHAYGRD